MSNEYGQRLSRLQCCLKWTIISLLFTPFVIFLFLVLLLCLGIVGEFYFIIIAPIDIYPAVAEFDGTDCSPTSFYTAFVILVSLHIVIGVLVVVGIVCIIVCVCSTFKAFIVD